MNHRNLLFTFHSTALEPNLCRHKVFQVIRWALFLSAFSYRIKHVPGKLNVMADTMNRQMRWYRLRSPHQLVARVTGTHSSSMIPTDPTGLTKWLSRHALRDAPEERKSARVCIADDDGPIRVNGKLFVPTANDALRIKLLTFAHAGQAGPRGANVTVAALKERLLWAGMSKDGKSFVSNFLLCVLSKSGSTVPRPLAQTLHSTKPDDVHHFNYLFVGDSTNNNKYDSVAKVDFSGYATITLTSNATAVQAVETLSRWQRTFTSPSYWVSDQGLHFVNELLSNMASTFCIQHSPTVVYSP